MAYKAKPDLIIKKIEDDKSGRSKNYYVFSLSLNNEQEKKFNQSLKNIINEISENE